jgi:hypothetical protein
VTRFNDPASGHGWQATPGQPIPRAARQPAASGLLLVMLLLVWFSPLSIVAWLAGQAVILLQRRWHWWRFALASLAALGVVLAVTGPEEALRRHVFVPQHFWQYVALHFGFGPPGTRVTVGQFLWDLLATQVWLAVPVGLLAASLSVWKPSGPPVAPSGAPSCAAVSASTSAPATAAPPGCSPAPVIASSPPRPWGSPWMATSRLGARAATWSRQPSCGARPWPWSAPPGAGKTVTLLRLAYLAARAGRKVCFADCKAPTRPDTGPGPDRRLPARQPFGSGRLLARAGDGHVAGTPAQVQSRLLAVEQFTEPFYQRVASAGLRPALTAPDMPLVEGSDELLRRLDPDELAVLWEGCPLQLKDIEAIGEHLPGARLRYADFFAALAGAFDRGRWSYEDVDLAVLTVPTLISKSEADAAMRVVLEDYGHYATGRKPREGEDALLILDEFSALASGVDSAINLAERVRDVGVQVVVVAQSVEGLGDHRQAPRLLASCAGGVVVHQCPDPERLLALAGQQRVLEHNWELDFYGPRGLAKARMGDRPRIDPEAVRQAQPGEAWVIQAGESIHLRVLPPPAVDQEPVERVATLPLADDTIPLPVVEEPAPVGIAAAVTLAGRTVRRVGQRVGRHRERPGRLPSPARRPWLPVRPLPGRERR